MSYHIFEHLRDLHSTISGEVSLTRSRIFPKATTFHEKPQIPNPNLFNAISIPSADTLTGGLTSLPTISECAVHLELLSVFYSLRTRIINSTELDTTFGVAIKKRTVYRTQWRKGRYVKVRVELADGTWQERRREKWSYFLAIAAARFRVWLKRIEEVMGEKASTASVGGVGLKLPYLPPIDILMVWHAFLLNPHDYHDFCTKNQLERVLKLSFPWAEIHRAIKLKDLSFTIPKPSANWSKEYAHVEADLMAYLEAAGGAANVVSSHLSHYGDGSIDSQSIKNDMKSGETDSDHASFLSILLQTEGEKQENKALTENVRRQTSFVDKMENHLWIRSPSLQGTLRRAIDRYDKFLKLSNVEASLSTSKQAFNRYPKTLVPTLDIDLVWHTHQCSSLRYKEASIKRTGRFLNHNDKLGKSVLGDGMKLTGQLFFVRFGEEYLKCLCWECEAVTSAIEELDSEGTSPGANAVVETVRRRVQFYRATEQARRGGWAPPAVKCLNPDELYTCRIERTS